MDNKNKKLTPIVCDVCGKRIIRGRPIHKVCGLTHTCCSASCLLYATAPYYIEESTGYIETQEEDKKGWRIYSTK